MPRSNIINPLDRITYFIVDSIVPYLIKLNVHPNLVTLIGFVPIYFIHVNMLSKRKILVYLFAFVNYTFDCLDGELARKSGKTSKLGGILDSIHDIITIFSLLYLVFKLYAIPIVIIFIILIKYIFDLDPINHTAKKYKKFFNLGHDNLNIIYILSIEITFRFLNK